MVTAGLKKRAEARQMGNPHFAQREEGSWAGPSGRGRPRRPVVIRPGEREQQSPTTTAHWSRNGIMPSRAAPLCTHPVERRTRGALVTVAATAGRLEPPESQNPFPQLRKLHRETRKSWQNGQQLGPTVACALCAYRAVPAHD